MKTQMLPQNVVQTLALFDFIKTLPLSFLHIHLRGSGLMLPL